MNDPGNPTSYLTLERGTHVRASDGTDVGRVTKVLAAGDQDIFDGVLVESDTFGTRFIDAQLVDRIYERLVELSIPASEVESQPQGQTSSATFEADLGRRGPEWRRDN